jgi:hypothetical protein
LAFQFKELGMKTVCAQICDNLLSFGGESFQNGNIEQRFDDDTNFFLTGVLNSLSRSFDFNRIYDDSLVEREVLGGRIMHEGCVGVRLIKSERTATMANTVSPEFIQATVKATQCYFQALPSGWIATRNTGSSTQMKRPHTYDVAPSSHCMLWRIAHNHKCVLTIEARTSEDRIIGLPTTTDAFLKALTSEAASAASYYTEIT